ncbi:MAG: chemotaxis protein CheC [Methanoregulaceae archaeon]|jgi:chemotaxis protein CheC|nr:chemotaxis protein CheC [Methanoregulaceae archaeon]
MKLTHGQTDALQELGNIGAAHAATTLSTMLSANVSMSVPEIKVIDISEIYKYVGDEIAALVLFQVNGEVKQGGYLLLYVAKSSVIRLTNAMLGLTDMERELDEMDESALLEVGNIMVSAFLDGTAGLLNIIMLPSPPQLVIDMPHAAIESIIASQDSIDIDEVVLFKTEMVSDAHNIQSSIFLFPNHPMLEDIIRRLEDILNPSM